MKKFIFGMIAVLFTLPALADGFPTVTPLLAPASLSTAYQVACSPIGFNADDSVFGVCHSRKYSVCSGRACSPIVYTTNYNVEWDLNGIATSSVMCDQETAQVRKATQYVYFNGFTSCSDVSADPYNEVTYVFYGSYSWQYTTYFYVATSADGLYTIVDSAIVYPATAPVKQN